MYEDVELDVYEDEDQIRVMDLLNIIWEGRMKILVITILMFCFGMFHFITTPEEYETNSRFLPERQVQQFQMDRMFAFGEFARSLNIGGAQSDGSLPSYFYPDIIGSVDFQEELLSREVDLINSDRRITLFEYFTTVYEQPFRSRVYSFIRRNTIGLPARIIRSFSGLFSRGDTQSTIVEPQAGAALQDTDNSIMAGHVIRGDRYTILSPEFEYVRQSVFDRISVDYGTLTIEVGTMMPDPMAAVQLNSYVADMLQEYLIEYRIEKARDNLQYIEVLYEEAEERYEEAQYELAMFLDSNKGILTALAEIERERLDDRRDLAFSLYSSVSNRLEEARTRLKEDTPIYTSFELPVLPSQPRGANMLVLPASIVVGLFLGVLWTFAEKLILVIGRVFGLVKGNEEKLKEDVS